MTKKALFLVTLSVVEGSQSRFIAENAEKRAKSTDFEVNFPVPHSGAHAAQAAGGSPARFGLSALIWLRARELGLMYFLV